MMMKIMSCFRLVLSLWLILLSMGVPDLSPAEEMLNSKEAHRKERGDNKKTVDREKEIGREKLNGSLGKIRSWEGEYSFIDEQSNQVHQFTYIGIGVAVLIFAVFWVWFCNLRLRRLAAQKTKDLKTSEARYRRIFNSFPDIYYETSPADEILEISPSVKRVTGYSREELLGNKITRLFRNMKNWEEMTERIFKTHRIDNHEVVLTRKDGKDIFGAINAILIENPAGEEQVIVASFRDINERKKLEQRLSYLSQAMECLGEMVIVTDLNHVITYTNSAVTNILGYSQEEMMGHKAGEFFDGIPGNDANLLENISSSSRGDLDIWRGELFNRKKDGGIIKIYLTLAWLKNESGKIIGTVGVSMDITEYRELEDQLRHSQKLEAVGTLAGGIAHDFNNLLAGAIGYLSIIINETPKDSSMLPTLKAIDKLLWRGSDLTGALLTFSRKGVYRPIRMNINRVIKDVLEIIARTAGKDTEIITDLSREIYSVFGDPGQIYQVVMNLCLNACEAMPNGGELTIGTRNTELKERFFRINPELKKGPYIQISISDSGFGIEEEIRERIFTPFFSTKDIKAGVGLGLSVVSGIVKRHGGIIKTESKVGEGSSFNVYLPASSENEQTFTPGIRSKTGSQENILIVDDNQDFQKVMKVSLDRLGYKTINADSGSKAIKILSDSENKIDLVLLDIIMKGMGGAELFHELRQIRPDLPVVICSGYSHNLIVEDLLNAGADDFIQKPFDLMTLNEKIRIILALEK